MLMPDFHPETETVEAPWAGDGKFSRGQLRHPIVKAPDGRLAVDVFVHPRRGTMADVWRKQDHPNLHKLPPNAPRAVKSLYRADGQLAHLRGTGDYWTEISTIAFDAWDDFVSNGGIPGVHYETTQLDK